MSGLLLLHGFTGAPASWDEVMAHLRPGTRVLRPALAGHGPRPARVTSWDAEVARLAALLEGESDVHLVGYSMGGRLGWSLLAHRVPGITRATLIGAHPGLIHDSDRAARTGADARWVTILERQGLRAFVDAWEGLPLWASQARLDEERRAARRAIRMSHDPMGLAAALETLGLASMPPTPLAAIRTPVRLVVGALDATHLGIANDALAALPQAQLHVVSDAGHDVAFERPAALAALLEREAPCAA